MLAGCLLFLYYSVSTATYLLNHLFSIFYFYTPSKHQKTSENITIFWCFQGLEKCNIGKKMVWMSLVLAKNYIVSAERIFVIKKYSHKVMQGYLPFTSPSASSNLQCHWLFIKFSWVKIWTRRKISVILESLKPDFEILCLKFAILTSWSPFSSSKKDKHRRLFKAFSMKSSSNIFRLNFKNK